MKRTMRIFSVLLALLLVCTVFVTGCDKGNGKTDNSTEKQTTAKQPTEQETEPAEEKLVLSDETTLARIVIPFGASDNVTDSAESVAQMLKKASGKTVKVVNDSETYVKDTVEILIGPTSYAETQTVAGELGYGAWTLRVIGNKVVIYATPDDAYSTAVKKLVSLLYTQQGKEQITISATYSVSGDTGSILSAIPTFTGSQDGTIFSTGATGFCKEISFTGVTESDYTTYRTAVLNAGYTVEAENQIGNNHYVSYTNDKYLLTLSYLPDIPRINVSIEKLTDTALPTTEAENTYVPGVCDTTVTQLGLWIGYEEGDAWDKWINGLSHVIRLTDGSFIVIDGGHDREMNDELLYETLKKQAPNPEHIVISAWIFTHTHGDHVGTFLLFDHSDVTVERFICNFPQSSVSANGDGGSTASVWAKMTTKYPNAKITHAHPGQVFNIRNAKITIYWSMDLFYPTEFTFFNESSLVFSVELEGHKIMYLGDMGPTSNTTVLRIYGSALESEIVQTAHHGFEGANYSTYSTIKPKYVFWNTGKLTKELEHIKTRNGNDYFADNDSIVKWLAADTVTVVTLKKNQNPSAVTYESSEAYFAS